MSPPPTLALILCFRTSHLATKLEELADQLKDQVKWNVMIQALNKTSSAAAQEDLQKAVDKFIDSRRSKDQRLVVYFGGYGMRVSSSEGRWHAHTGPVCAEHVVTVNPERMLRSLQHRTTNNILFILHCPLEYAETSFNTWAQLDKNSKKTRIVQVLNLRENWSAPANMEPGPCQGGDGTCMQNILQVPKGFDGDRTTALWKLLVDSIKPKVYLDLLQLHEGISEEGKKEAELWQVVGKAEEFEFHMGS